MPLWVKSNPKYLSNTYDQIVKGWISHIILEIFKHFFETMGQTQPHFQTILFQTIVMGCPFNRIHFLKNSKGCAHPMLNIFPPIVVGNLF